MVMRTEELNVFLYWVDERHRIYLRKDSGKVRPWTRNTILNEYRFTNPFRENDRVTKVLRSKINKSDNIKSIFKKIVIFRMFNWPDTYNTLWRSGLVNRWDTEKAISLLTDRKERGYKTFTGAYIITNSGSREPKINLVCKAIGDILDDSECILRSIRHDNSLEESVLILSSYSMIGNFVGYELVTDLRHTRILDRATDIYTWANPGPGARRGTHRILFGTERGQLPKKTKVDYQVFMQDLMRLTQNKLGGKSIFKNVLFEMRDIEHSLCEFDKYMRVSNGEGRPRGKYK